MSGTVKYGKRPMNSANANNPILITMLYGIRRWIESGKRVGTESILNDIDIIIKDLRVNPKELLK